MGDAGALPPQASSIGAVETYFASGWAIFITHSQDSGYFAAAPPLVLNDCWLFLDALFGAHFPGNHPRADFPLERVFIGPVLVYRNDSTFPCATPRL
jgi:hypothetical protein